MADNDPQTNYVYEARLIAHSYFSRSYQFEEIELGTFSKETFAIDASVLEIKEGIYDLYKILVEELNDRKEDESLLSEEESFTIEGLEKVVEFLKETYNNSFNDNFDVKKVNELIKTISSTLQETKNFDVDDYYRQNDSSYFFPFFSTFYDNQLSEEDEKVSFFLEIKEFVVDKFSSGQEFPPTIE